MPCSFSQKMGIPDEMLTPVFKEIRKHSSFVLCSILHRKSSNRKVFSEILLGPVVQSVVSLTSSLRVISLTVPADSIHNILIYFAEKM